MAVPSLPPGSSPAAKPTPRFSASLSRYVTLGIVTCVLLIGGIGGWSATAKLSSAVIAGGQVVVASNVKEVQHADGGIVGEILVDDGDYVDEGDLLMRLDETLVKANRTLIDGQIIALEARLARLQAEWQSTESIAIPDELADRLDDKTVKQARDAEQKVFDARRDTISGQVERLGEQRKQLEDQVKGLVVQLDAKKKELELITEELDVLEELYDKGNTTRDRVVNMRRNKTRLEGESGDLQARIAVARGRIVETELEVIALTTELRERIFDEITEIKPELSNLKERRIAADFQLQRMDIRSPASGRVFEMTAHTVGGVVQPAEVIMQIVPKADTLLIEVRVSPVDVDQVVVGQDANIILSAFDTRTTPALHGTVTFVAAEASTDNNNPNVPPFYKVRIALNEGELERLPNNLVLLPGMPAEAYITTGGRTVIAYLMTPLTDTLRKTWRET